MMSYVADTKILVENIRNNKLGFVYINEFTIFEFLKNKTDNEKRRQLSNLINYVRKTSSILLTSENNLSLVDLDDLGSYIIALNICSRDARVISDTAMNMLYIILTINCLLTISSYKNTDRIKKAEDIMALTKIAFDKIAPQIKKDLPDVILNNRSEEINNTVLPYFYNQFVRKINQLTKDEKFKLKEIRKYSINEMISGVDEKTKNRYISQYVNRVLDFSKNEAASKQFYSAYLQYLYKDKNKIEINDYVDMNDVYPINWTS